MIRRWATRTSVILLAALVVASCAPTGTVTRDEEMMPDAVMGDWFGHAVTKTGEVGVVAVQSIALGGSDYRFIVHGDFDTRESMLDKLVLPLVYDATLDGDRLVVKTQPEWSITLSSGVLRGRAPGTDVDNFELRHIVRRSPTLGAVPPQGAVVLFDGSTLEGWERRDPKQRDVPVGWTASDGAMHVVPKTGDIMTKRRFTDFQLHIEFRTPFMPTSMGQARGNSGVYLQGRYEVQVLDSYGLKGEDNECGGIYKVSAPAVNMCAPPGQWQTYDITFRAPRVDAAGAKTSDAVVTVIHNGKVIHDALVIPGVTGGALDEAVGSPGPLLLQDHGDLVQYRNIWLVDLKR
jgi:hypothetical protein